MLSGYDMSDVRVYYASALPAQMGARAYAYGTCIYIERGAEDDLPHEAWHVVQQKQGRVRVTAKLQDAPLNDDPMLEMEADTMGAQASRLSLSAAWSRLRKALSKTSIDKPVVQRVVTIGSDIVSTARAIREKLNNRHNLTANNTPHLTAIVDDIVAKKRTFTDLLTVKNEVKRRSFGHRHVNAIEALFQQQETARQAYMNAHTLTEAQLLKKVTQITNASSRRILAFSARRRPRLR
jgi:hypothetical protein